MFRPIRFWAHLGPTVTLLVVSFALVAVSLFAVLAPRPQIVLAQTEPESVARMVLFHSPSCPHCRDVLEKVLPPLQEKYGDQLEVHLFNISEADNYAYFLAFQQHTPHISHAIPEAIIDRYVLIGTDSIQNGLPGQIDACLANGGCDWPIPISPALVAPTVTEPVPQASPSTDAANTEESEAATQRVQAGEEPAIPASVAKTVHLAYFFDPTCLECERVTYDLAYLQSLYPHLQIARFDMRQEAALNEALCEHYQVPFHQRLVAPAIFVGQHYLIADEITVPRLQALIERPDIAAAPSWETMETKTAEATARERLVERFKSFGLVAVLGAGLLDGVNPCAFTTIIFFISYLTLVGRKGRDLLLVGAAFTVAVFLTYLAMGLGLAEIVRQIEGISLIGRLLYGTTALVCLVLAALSVWDYAKIRQGKLSEIALQLPKSLKARIHSTIRSRSRMQGYIGAAFGAGILVSVFELACTGQVYLPTIVFVTGVAELRLTALAYLALYNLMFVVPLVLVFTVTYLGTSNQQITARFQANVGTVKLATALLFGVLGIWLGYLVLA